MPQITVRTKSGAKSKTKARPARIRRVVNGRIIYPPLPTKGRLFVLHPVVLLPVVLGLARPVSCLRWGAAKNRATCFAVAACVLQGRCHRSPLARGYGRRAKRRCRAPY